MKKIKNRSYFIMFLAFSIVLGLGVFMFRVINFGGAWVALSSNQTAGTITDRNGEVLLSIYEGDYEYSSDEITRISTLHVVGDVDKNIGTSALSNFGGEIHSYNVITGVHGLSDEGGELKLTIDSNLQEQAYTAMAGRSGSVIISNYETNEILCSYSGPSYDPNNKPDLSLPQYDGVYLNRGLSSTYAPGSVFKLVTLAAAIENIYDLYERSFSCWGSVEVGGNAVNCSGVHGTINIDQALAFSCNCAFSDLAQELGSEIIIEYAEKYGLLSPININGVTTTKGSLDQAATGTSDLSWLGIGQYTDLVSPIAMENFVCAIANGGSIYEPSLILGQKGDKIGLIKSSTAQKLKEMMNYNVAYSYGTWNFGGLNVSAKSGTAETGDGTSHSWLVGFLNDENNPLAFCVMIENGGGGLSQCAPVITSLLQEAIK